jgi:hypothetical protein
MGNHAAHHEAPQHEAASKADWAHLLKDILLYKVGPLLSEKDLMHITQVCHAWRVVGRSDVLWKPLLEKTNLAGKHPELSPFEAYCFEHRPGYAGYLLQQHFDSHGGRVELESPSERLIEGFLSGDLVFQLDRWHRGRVDVAAHFQSESFCEDGELCKWRDKLSLQWRGGAAGVVVFTVLSSHHDKNKGKTFTGTISPDAKTFRVVDSFRSAFVWEWNQSLRSMRRKEMNG